MILWRRLAWDSDFFGFPVAIIDDATLRHDDLRELLPRLREEGVKLVYWPSASPLEEEEEDNAAEFLREFGGFLADQKTMFVCDLAKRSSATRPAEPTVVLYNGFSSEPELIGLAVQSGESSRFAVDPRIPRARYEALYENWMRNAVTGEMADAVFVIRAESRIVAMVTVQEKVGRGDIGLIAVDHAFRGRGYGEALVRTAQDWTLHRGLEYAQVCTQGDNSAACNLYRKCGYVVESVQYYYHFWL